MNLLEVLETDERGEAMSKEYPVVNRKYYLKEIQASDGYVLDPDIHEIHLAENSIKDVFIKNAKTPKETETIIVEKDPEPEIIIVEKEPEVIVQEIEPDPVYEEVIIGEPRIIKKAVKLPRTGM